MRRSRSQMAAVWGALLTIFSSPVSAGSELHGRYFGHDLRIADARDGAERDLLIDGKSAESGEVIDIEDVAVVGGVGVIVGHAGPGGNACNPPPFVIAFPPDAPPKDYSDFDVDCGYVKTIVERERIIFREDPSPRSEGRQWVWGPASGLSKAVTLKFDPDPAKTWATLRLRADLHPLELMSYPEIAAQIDALLGPDRTAFLDILDVGDGKVSGDVYVGRTCKTHMCDVVEALVVADIAARKVYLAWKPERKPIVVRPDVHDWSVLGRVQLRDWAAKFAPKK